MRALLAGDHATATELLERELGLRPDDAALRCNYGAALHAMGRHAEAAAAYRHAIDAGGEPAALLAYNLGSALAASGDGEGAEAAYRRAIERDPGMAEAHGNLGVLLFERGDLDGARAALDQAIARSPDDVTMRCNLGAVLLARGDAEAAVQAYGDALEGAPDDAAVLCGLAGALGLAGAPERAVALLDGWTGPRAVDIVRHLAAACGQAGDAARAEALHRELLDTNADDAWAHNGLGTALEAQGRHRDAEMSFRRALALAPAWIDAHYNLGVCLERDGRLEDAAGAYQAALALHADHVLSLKNLAGVLRLIDRADESLAMYGRLRELVPEDPVVAHLHAAMRGETTARAPVGYVRDVFDDYAARYDRHMVEKLAYAAPSQMARLLEVAAPGARFARAVDLGCGTGLCGRALRARIDHLVGIDLSPEMLARCAGYDELANADVLEHLGAAPPACFELIFAADVLIYLGDLAPLFAAVRRALAPGGLWLFSVELAGAGDYTLTDTGRYAHSRAYLSRGLAAATLAEVAAEPVVLRREHDVPVAGLVLAAASAHAPGA